MPGQRSKGNPDPSRALAPGVGGIAAAGRDDRADLPEPLASPIGAAPLPALGLIAAGAAAVALSTITAGAEKKQSAAFATRANPWPENYFANNRHAYSQGGTGQRPLGFVAG